MPSEISPTMKIENLYRDLKKLLQYVLMLSFLKLVFKTMKSNTMCTISWISGGYNNFHSLTSCKLFVFKRYWLDLGGGRRVILDTFFSVVLHWFEAFFTICRPWLVPAYDESWFSFRSRQSITSELESGFYVFGLQSTFHITYNRFNGYLREW